MIITQYLCKITPMKHPKDIPNMVFADSEGNILDFPELKMAGRVGQFFHPIEPKDLIPLPKGSELFVLPNRLPIGWDPVHDEMIALCENPFNPKESIQAVAAFIAPAHTQTAIAAFLKKDEEAPALPLFCYTAVGWWQGKFWVAAFRSDPDPRQDADRFDMYKVKKKTLEISKKFNKNRLIRHLVTCSLHYGCPAARNFFLGRWEAPVPTSPVCNARCIGCISNQPKELSVGTQNRINFVPSVEEIVELCTMHLRHAPAPIVSFGQGCEGEPLLQVNTIEEAIKKIRKDTLRGTINLNSNASLPNNVERLAVSGLDSIRISLNSCREKYYMAYYRPKGYRFSNVLESAKVMKKYSRFVSINLFITPGLTDELDEIDELSRIIEEYKIDLIQLRNHNIDPDMYFSAINFKPSGQHVGIKNMIKILKKRHPFLRFGYFNPCLNP